MRECYLKRVSVRNDMHLYFQQKLAQENIKGFKENLV
jgi:hypothetical protein